MFGPRTLWGTTLVACASAALLVMSATSADAAAAESPATSAVAAAAAVADTFESVDCPVDVPSEYESRATCSVLVVPESTSPESDPEKTLRLAVIVIASRSLERSSDPLVVPTSGGLFGLSYFLDDAGWALADRDLILVEQRGDALADPSLDCPELNVEHFIVDGALLNGAAHRAQRSAQIEACRARLTAEGIDLAAYTSARSVVDLSALRAALGYDAWNLYGASDGSRLALTVMRDRPEGLRAVILDGVHAPLINRYEQTPAGFTAAIDTLLADCRTQRECRKQYPDLEKSLMELLARAAEAPLTVTVTHPIDRSPVTLTLTDTDLVDLLFEALADAEFVRALPLLIDRLASGDTQALLPLAQRHLEAADALAEGRSLSIDCAEEAPFNNDARIAAALAAEPILAHYARSDGFREDCALWAVPALPDAENAPVVSAIPTLLTTGGYDPVAPMAFADAAAASLSVHYSYRFPGLGHVVVDAPCAARIAQQFLADPAITPAAACIDVVPPADFIAADDVHNTTAIYRLDRDLVQHRDPLQITITGLTILVFLATLVYAAIYGLAWLGRRRGEAPGGLVLVAATSSGLNLAYVGGLALIMLNTDPILLAFGLPSGLWPMLIAPFIALGATILLIASLVRAWMQEEGSLFHRIALSVSAGASACFALWLLARGLLML